MNSDLISRNALLEDLRKVQFTNVNGQSMVTASMIFMLIDRQPKAREWTPCSVGLPNDGDDDDYYPEVNVTLRNGTATRGVYRNYDKEWWIQSKDGSNRYILSDEVIAWQPLPEPWKGAEE